MNRQDSPALQHKVSNRISDPALPPRSESFSSGGIQQARTPPMHRSVEPQVRGHSTLGGGDLLDVRTCYFWCCVELGSPSVWRTFISMVTGSSCLVMGSEGYLVLTQSDPV